MDANLERNVRQPGPHWRLNRADPQMWTADGRGAAGSVGRLAVRGLRKRKLLAMAGIAAALAPVLAWMFLVPAEYHATVPIVFDQPQGLADRTKLLTAARGPELRRLAADACGLRAGGIKLTAAAPDLRTLVLGASHSNRTLAVRAVEASTETLRALTPAVSRLHSPIAVQPLRLTPLRGLLLLAAAAVGCMAAAVVALRLESRSRPISSASELAEITSVPVLLLSEETSLHVS